MGKLTLYKPHKKQLEIHDAIDGPGKYYFVSIGRQFGKTMLGENQGLKWCLENGWKVAWISPTYKQCKKVFKEVVRALGKCPFYDKPPNHSELTITFNNGAILIFYSAEAYDSIRGETFDAAIGDEMAYWKPEAWDEVIKATLLVKGKKFLGLSTPKGKGQFYKLHKLAEHNDNYHSFVGTSFDNPHIDPDEIEEARRNLPDHIFRQEYLAEFLEDGSGVFPNIKDCIKIATGRQYYAGVDLGRADDYTVLTIVDENDTEVYSERWRHMEWSAITDEVAKVLNQYKPQTLIESNGTQDAIYEIIRNKVTYNKNSIQPFVTTSKSKPIIIEDLIVGFEEMGVGILGHEWQVAELEAFTYTYNVRTRAIKYEAPSGLHDDYVMSRAIASYARKTLKMSGKYFIR